MGNSASTESIMNDSTEEVEVWWQLPAGLKTADQMLPPGAVAQAYNFQEGMDHQICVKRGVSIACTNPSVGQKAFTVTNLQPQVGGAHEDALKVVFVIMFVVFLVNLSRKKEKEIVQDSAQKPLLAGSKPGEEPSFCEMYLKKCMGAGAKGPPVQPWHYSGMSWVGSFTGIATLGLLQTFAMPYIGPYIYSALTIFLPIEYKPDYSLPWIIIGSFGATAVLVYGQPKAPPAQPWNTLFGNTLGALIGMSIFQLAEFVGLQQQIWLTGSLSVSLTIVAQEITQSQHPPGGATALLTSIMPNLQATHFIYVLCPGLLGPVILVSVSMLVNNLSQVRSYPDTWANPWSQSCAPETQKEPSTAVGKYLAKFSPKGGNPMPRPPLKETFFSWLGSFIGIAILGALQQFAMPGFNKEMGYTDLVTIIGSFGAVAVLVCSLPASPLSQPKNVMLGDTIGAAIGVAVVKTFELTGLGHPFWLMAALAVSLTIVAQERATCAFPPGGATSLIFVLRSCAAGLPAEHPFHVGDVWDWYVILPGFFGPWLLMTVAVFTNNLSPKRTYPSRWWDGA